jgi:hypothetical protein
MIGLILLGGLAYRIRGGLIDQIIGRDIPNGYIRAVWALYITIALMPAMWVAPLVFGLAFAGVVPGYFGGRFDLTLKENRTWRNYGLLAARGAFIIGPLAFCFYPLYPSLAYGALAGALMPLCYLAGGVIIKFNSNIVTSSPSQWGEFLIGCCIGATL